MTNARMAAYIAAAIFSVSLTVTAPLAGDMDGVMMSGGRMMMMKDGKPSGSMDHEMILSDGKTRVTTDGTIKVKGGEEVVLKDGDMVMMDGHIMLRGGKPPAMHE